jgi:hypothetical protein
MFNPFKRIRCQCTFCNKAWRILLRRILHFEKLFDIQKGSASGGFANAMIATKGWLSRILIGTFMAKQLKLIPMRRRRTRDLDPNTEVVRF